MALALFTPPGFFNASLTSFTMINSYRTKAQSNNTRSLPPGLIFPCLPGPTLTPGDLTIHQPTADLLRNFTEVEIAASVHYFDRATEHGFSLLNTLGLYTRFSMSLVGMPGVIDLAFPSPLLMPYISEWSDPLPSTGSDHSLIPPTIRSTPVPSTPSQVTLGPDRLAPGAQRPQNTHNPCPPLPPDLPLPGALVRYQLE